MKRREDGRRKELARESGQTKRGQEKGRERKEREIEKKNMVTDESQKVSVTQFPLVTVPGHSARPCFFKSFTYSPITV